jgi:hypothetical protein
MLIHTRISAGDARNFIVTKPRFLTYIIKGRFFAGFVGDSRVFRPIEAQTGEALRIPVEALRYSPLVRGKQPLPGAYLIFIWDLGFGIADLSLLIFTLGSAIPPSGCRIPHT